MKEIVILILLTIKKTTNFAFSKKKSFTMALNCYYEVLKE